MLSWYGMMREMATNRASVFQGAESASVSDTAELLALQRSFMRSPRGVKARFSCGSSASTKMCKIQESLRKEKGQTRWLRSSRRPFVDRKKTARRRRRLELGGFCRPLARPAELLVSRRIDKMLGRMKIIRPSVIGGYPMPSVFVIGSNFMVPAAMILVPRLTTHFHQC